jgi:hypothetical protein
MPRLFAFLLVGVISVSGNVAFAERATREPQERTLFERNRDAIDRAERRRDVEPRVGPDRLINDSERHQMERLENDPANR